MPATGRNQVGIALKPWNLKHAMISKILLIEGNPPSRAAMWPALAIVQGAALHAAKNDRPS